MKLKRFTAVLLIALLCLSGCKPSAEEEIMANTQQPVQQTVPQTQLPQTEQPETVPGTTTQSPAGGQTQTQQPAAPQTQAPTTQAQPTTPAQPSGSQTQQPTAPTPEQPSGTTQPQQPTNTPTEQQPTTQEKDNTVVDLATDVRYFGRTYEQNGTYWFNWTASGFEFTINGTGAEAMIESENNGDEHVAFLKIYIDGKEQAKNIPLTDTMQTVTLAKGLKKGVHTIRVVKRTNGRSASAGVSDITLAKNTTIMAPPAASERRIEFVGDSITVGYGVLSTSSADTWSTKTEDGTKTYAALAATALRADFNVIAISGRGLAHNTSGDTDKLMPFLYPQLDGYNNAGVAWNFKSWQPHVVVINLGTNDHKNSSGAEVTTAATAFLKNVRKNNPNAYIIFAYGMMGNTHEGAIKAAISACGDHKTSFLPLKNSETRVIGHPNPASHKENALTLEKEIRRLTGWKD